MPPSVHDGAAPAAPLLELDAPASLGEYTRAVDGLSRQLGRAGGRIALLRLCGAAAGSAIADVPLAGGLACISAGAACLGCRLGQ